MKRRVLGSTSIYNELVCIPTTLLQVAGVYPHKLNEKKKKEILIDEVFLDNINKHYIGADSKNCTIPE